MSQDKRSDTSLEKLEGGPFLAKIISHLDPTYQGVLEVELLREVGPDSNDPGQRCYVRYMSPFYGVTSADHLGADPNDYNNTQKSYGMWMIPPDVGTKVVVIFIRGDIRDGYWIGCVPDEGKNFMVPGNPSTKMVVDGSKSTSAERVPTAEYNSLINNTVQEPTKYKKPAHPFEITLDQQGLLLDDIRGITTSSARREIPSMVFGISTPGPIDKTDGAKQGKVGKSNDMTTSFVSRLGGSTFVMDDGDDKFLRKTKASNGPPEYAAVELGETSGLPNIPHNELVRLRTRTGHQILMHNSEDLMYIANARGTAWIELTSDGKIDIFAEDSVSIRTKNDFNFHADRDVNIFAGRNVNLNAVNEICVESGSNYKLRVGADYTIQVVGKNDTTTGGLFQVASSGTNIDGGEIHLNSGKFAGTNVDKLVIVDNPADVGVTPSIMLRTPSHEPWPHHENLDPVKFKKDKTDRDSGSAIPAPVKWKQYSTVVDTFEKLGEPNQG